MKLDLAIEELHRSENELYTVLLSMSDRHTVDHEVFHVTRDMASGRSGTSRSSPRRAGSSVSTLTRRRGHAGLLEALQQKAAELTGRRSAPGMLLLADLRHLYREASGTSLDWELLAQGAQGAKNKELLELAERCHPQTLRLARWAERQAQGVLAPGPHVVTDPGISPTFLPLGRREPVDVAVEPGVPPEL